MNTSLQRRARSGASRARRGMSLIELVIGTAVLATIVGVVVVVARSGSQAYRVGSTATTLEALARRTTGRMARELRDAGRGTLVPPPLGPLGATSADFQRNGGFAAGAVQWTPTRRLALQADGFEVLGNGVDDDGDGLVDEGVAVLVEDALGAAPQTRVLARWVRALGAGELANGVDDDGDGLIDEPGLVFVVDGSTLTIQLTLERADPDGRLVAASSETTVTLRNP